MPETRSTCDVTHYLDETDCDIATEYNGLINVIEAMKAKFTRLTA